MKKLRILVADDHNLVRYGIINTLEEYEWIAVVGEAETGDMLIEKYFQFNPDIALADINMPRRNGMQAAKKILNKDPDAKIVFLSMFSTDQYIYDAMKIGVKGLLPKEIMKGDLVHALKVVFEGGRYFNGLSDEQLNEIKEKYDTLKTPEKISDKYNLTAREIDILELMADGASNEEIAEKLFIAVRTVESHRSSIMGKLNIHSTPRLIIFAFEHFGKKSDESSP